MIHHDHSSPFTIITIQHAPFPSSQSSSCILHHSFFNHHLSYHLSCILMSLIPILKLPKILTTCCWCEVSTASSPKQSTVTRTDDILRWCFPRWLASCNAQKVSHLKRVLQMTPATAFLKLMRLLFQRLFLVMGKRENVENPDRASYLV